jgi:hypothetical protein
MLIKFHSAWRIGHSQCGAKNPPLRWHINSFKKEKVFL